MRNVYVVGTTRSCTGVTTNCLSSHPHVAGFFQHTQSYRRCRDVIESKYKEFPAGSRYAAFQIPGYTSNILKAWEVYKESPDGENFCVFMVRNPIDSAISVLQKNGGQWAMRNLADVKDADILKLTKQDDVFNAVMAIRAAELWAKEIMLLKSMVQKGVKVLPVSHELLIRRPKSQLMRVCEFLGLDWDLKMLCFPFDTGRITHCHLDHLTKNHVEMIITSTKTAREFLGTQEWGEEYILV